MTEIEKIIAAIHKKLKQEEVKSEEPGAGQILIQIRNVIPYGSPAEKVKGEGNGFNE